MCVITERHHQLHGVTQKDVKFVSISLYDTELYPEPRYNVCVKFEPDSAYAQLHNKHGFVKLLFTPSNDIRFLRRKSEHPRWDGFSTYEIWREEEKKIDKNSMVFIGKGKFLNEKGCKLTPEPAYFTMLGVSAFGSPNNALSLFAKLKIFDFETEMDLTPAHDNDNFSHITYQTIYHDEEA